MPETIICAHRGLDDSAPENTLAAFEAALKKGMAIEFDVQITADEQLVIMHDETVDRTTDGSGKVSEMYLGELLQLDAGSWFGPDFAGQRIPTLDEALEFVSSRTQVSPPIALDVKRVTSRTIYLICGSLEKHSSIEDVVGIGAIIYSDDARRRFAARSVRFPCAAVAQTSDELGAAMEDNQSKWVYARFVPTTRDVQAVRQAGKRLFVSGKEVSTDVNRAFDAYHAGPDMVLTWHPTTLAELVDPGPGR